MLPKQSLYYEFVDDRIVPYWYVITFEPCQIPWEDPTCFFQLIAPFQYMERDAFDDNIISMAIHIDDLIINKEKKSMFGLNLERIKNRLTNELFVDPYVVRQFIIPMPDIEEVLLLIPNERKATFLLHP